MVDDRPDVLEAFETAQRALSAISGPRWCRRCEATVDTPGDRCPTCQCWLTANTAAVKTGERSAQLRQRIVTSQELADLEREITADLGGADNLTALERERVNAVAFKILLKQNSTHVALAESGALTGRDRKRSALETYLRLDDAIRRDLDVLGLKRRTRDAVDLARNLTGQR